MSYRSVLRASIVIVLAFALAACGRSKEEGDTTTEHRSAVRDAQSILDGLASEDSREATEMLLAATADDGTFAANYPILIQVVEAEALAEGLFDLEVLEQACSERPTCKFTPPEFVGARKMGVLTWVSQCIWGLSPGPEKDRLVQTFMDDIDRLISSGCVPPEEALGAAMNALMEVDWVAPQTDPTPLVNLLESHLKESDSACRECAWDSLKTIAYVCGDRRPQIIEFLNETCPEKRKLPVEPGYPGPGLAWDSQVAPSIPAQDPMTRQEYEGLFRMSPGGLADVVREHAPDYRIASRYGQMALKVLVAAARENEEGAVKELLSMAADGVRSSDIVRALLPEPLPEDAPSERKASMDAALDVTEEVLLTGQRLEPRHYRLFACLAQYGSPDIRPEMGYHRRSFYGQRRIIDILLTALSKDSSCYDHWQVLECLKSVLQRCSRENLRYALRHCQTLLADKDEPKGLSDAERVKARERFQEVVTTCEKELARSDEFQPQRESRTSRDAGPPQRHD